MMDNEDQSLTFNLGVRDTMGRPISHAGEGWLGSLDWLQRHNMLYGTELAETEERGLQRVKWLIILFIGFTSLDQVGHLETLRNYTVNI